MNKYSNFQNTGWIGGGGGGPPMGIVIIFYKKWYAIMYTKYTHVNKCIHYVYSCMF